MRYEADHKAKTHRKIVRNASRQLRAQGLSGPAVSTLMRASGLTHGGFYRHFGTRDELVAEAVEESLEELRDKLETAAKGAAPGEGWKAMVRTYLSIESCDGAEDGCPIAALAPDIARAKPALKRRIAKAILRFREAMLPYLPGRTAEEKAVNFLALFSSMVGAIEIARTMPEREVRERILKAVGERLAASF